MKDVNSGASSPPSDFFRKNRVPIILLFLTVVVFGSISLFFLDFTLIPDIEYPELVVLVQYPRASPEEVKNLVTVPIEQTTLALKGVKKVDSLSREGLCVIKIRYRWGENLNVAHIELREKLDMLASFLPRDVERPIILNYQSSQDPVAGLAVISKSMDPRELYLFCRKDIQHLIEKTEGIAHVLIQGGERPEVTIKIEPEKLSKYGLGIGEVRNAVASSNKSFPVGYFAEGIFEYVIQVDGEIVDYEDFGDIVIKEDENRFVTVRDIASIEYGTEEKKSDVVVDGQKALMLSIFKQPGYNVIAVSNHIDSLIQTLNERYRGEMRFEKVFDESIHIRVSLRDLAIAMALGVVFTIFSVSLFIADVRLSLIIVMTVPLSMLGTFVIMKIANISINLLTLGGFSLVLGMIVDNAVIVTTSLLDRSSEPSEDVLSRVKQVAPAVYSATLTTIVVFLPILFLQGILKVVFIQLSIVMVVSLLFSLVLSLSLIPVILDRMSPSPRSHSLQRNFLKGLDAIYAFVLRKVLNRRLMYLVVLIVLCIIGVFAYGGIDKRFLESLPQDHFFLEFFIRSQVPFRYTARLSEHITDVLLHDPRVRRVITMTGVDPGEASLNLDGRYGINTGTLRVYTHVRGSEVYEVINSLRPKLSPFQEVDFLLYVPDNPIQRLVSRSNFDVVLKMYDPSTAFLADTARRISGLLRDDPLVWDVYNSYYMSNSERAFFVHRDLLPVYRVEMPTIAEYLTTALSGLETGTWTYGDYEIPVRLRFDEEAFVDIEDVLSLPVKNLEGGEIRLKELVTVHDRRVPNMILRENQSTYSKIEFNRAKGDGALLAGFTDDRLLQRIGRSLSEENVEYRIEDQFSLLREVYPELLLALFLAVFLEYGILASNFRSFTKPVLVIAMIPLAIPGILLILFIIHSSLNINSFMSIIVLVGLLVNNAIMLFLEYGRRAVHSAKDVVDASVARLKPILITTLSTILALVPILFTGNGIQVSLAATLILGLLYSTTVTLVYLPLLYTTFFLTDRRM